MQVKSQRGEVLDVGRFIADHPEMVAIGNAGMNARGDKVGANGKIIKRREEIAAEYHRQNPKAVKQVSLKDLASEVLQPAEAREVMKREQAEAAAAAKAKADAVRQASMEADLRGPAPAAPVAAPAAADDAAKKTRKITDSDQ